MPRLSGPAAVLHLEGLALAVVAIVIFARTDGNWLQFVVLILAPDLSALGYWLVHLSARLSTIPCIRKSASGVGALWPARREPTCAWLALIWLCHIGTDRFFGFGLKYATEFKDTHLNRV